MKSTKSITALALLCTLSCENASELSAKIQVEGKEYVEVAVRKGAVSQKVTWRSQVTPAEKIHIMADSEMKISVTHVKNGMEVKQGDVLFELDKSEENKKFEKAKEDLVQKNLGYKSTVLQFESVKKTWQRKGRLFKRGVIARQEFEKAELDYEQSRNRLQQESLSLKQQKADLEEMQGLSQKSKITAPRSGVVSDLAFLRPDERINTGTKLCTIADPSSMALMTRISEQYLNQLAEGMEMQVSVDGASEQGLRGTLLTKARSGTYNTMEARMEYEIVVSLPASVITAREGSTGTIEHVVADAKDAIAIPAAALKSVGEDHFVLIASGITGEPKPKPVKIGIQTPIEVEILSGLDEGEKILIEKAVN